MRAQIQFHAALHDAKKVLMVAELHCHAAFEPTEGALDAGRDVLATSAVIDALIEGHDDVSAQTTLDIHRTLGRQRRWRAVDIKTKLHALFGDLTIRQTEDLETAGVSEDGLLPMHQLVQTAMAFDQQRAVGQAQVVGVGQHHLRASSGDLFRRHALHRSLGADRHKRWRFDHAMRSDEATATSAGRTRGLF